MVLRLIAIIINMNHRGRRGRKEEGEQSTPPPFALSASLSSGYFATLRETYFGALPLRSFAKLCEATALGVPPLASAPYSIIKREQLQP